MIVQTNTGTRLSGFFRGIVLKHLYMGKCKIWIPGIYPQEYASSPDKLPDAEQASPLFAGYNFGNGVFSYPNLGATVWCFFANEDQNYPVYFASTLGGSSAASKFVESAPELDEETGKEFPYKHLIVAGKSKITIFEGGQIFIETNGDKGTSAIKINNDGTIEISNDNTSEVISKNIKLTAKENFEIYAKNISLNSVDSTSLFASTIQTNSTGLTTVTSKSSPSGITL